MKGTFVQSLKCQTSCKVSSWGIARRQGKEGKTYSTIKSVIQRALSGPKTRCSLLSAYSVHPSWIQEALHTLLKDGGNVNMYCTLNVLSSTVTLLKECRSTPQIAKVPSLAGGRIGRKSEVPKDFS